MDYPSPISPVTGPDAVGTVTGPDAVPTATSTRAHSSDAVDTIEGSGEQVIATNADGTTVVANVDSLITGLVTYDANGNVIDTQKQLVGTRYDVVR